MNKKGPLRPNVCMLVMNRRQKLFLGERFGEPGVWQFPQGGVESDATLEENVLRELEEELGVDRRNLRIIKKLNSTHTYFFKKPRLYGEVEFSGQAQTFWLVEFSGKDSDIDLGRHEKEMEKFRWCTPDEVRTFAEPKRLAGYVEPLAEFEEYLNELSVKS